MELPEWQGPGPDPLPYLQSIYQYGGIMRAFPAYKLEDLDDAPVCELLTAMELLNTAQKVLA